MRQNQRFRGSDRREASFLLLADQLVTHQKRFPWMFSKVKASGRDYIFSIDFSKKTWERH
jgi:hypothetical protein